MAGGRNMLQFAGPCICGGEAVLAGGELKESVVTLRAAWWNRVVEADPALYYLAFGSRACYVELGLDTCDAHIAGLACRLVNLLKGGVIGFHVFEWGRQGSVRVRG